jgi:hypothetical protein
MAVVMRVSMLARVFMHVAMVVMRVRMDVRPSPVAVIMHIADFVTGMLSAGLPVFRNDLGLTAPANAAHPAVSVFRPAAAPRDCGGIL